MKSIITIALTPQVSMEFVLVEGGEFLMGDDQSEYEEEKPAHRVKLSSFYIGKYPVTQAQWEAVTADNPAYFKSVNRPVEMVTWFDIQGFIQKLSQQTGWQFHLPAEAEWEYAARGGKYNQGYAYSGSDRLKQVGWFKENSAGETHEVGLLLANELGIHDMSGNVWEWCADVYSEDYYRSCKQQGIVENPQGSDADSSAACVLRGGSYFNSSVRCRIACRGAYLLVYRSNCLGFRLCISPLASG